MIRWVRGVLLAAGATVLAAAEPASAEPVPAETVPVEHSPVSTVPLSRLETAWWRTRHQDKLAEIAALTRSGGHVDLVWLGDSITQDWELAGPAEWQEFAPVWRHFYGDRHALNLGFKGDTTAHLLWRMQNGELDGLTPKAVVILIGANNMGRVHWTAPQTVAGISAVVDEAHRRLPAARIILLGVLPSIRSNYVTRTTARVNHALAERYPAGALPWLIFVDATPLFLHEGQVDRTQFLDDQLTPPDPPLHPNPAAQAHVAQTIEPLVAAALGDRVRLAR